MRAHPNERFLGAPRNADAWTLLGIGEGVTLEGPVIDRALRSRLTMVNRHPGADSSDAASVRESLKRAADELREQIGKEFVRTPAPQPQPARRTAPRAPAGRAARPTGSSPGITLTEFDRQVLGTLVGSGGWNHASRSRLVAIASAHRVTVQGLLTVIRGLNDYARSGGARLDVATITAGKRMLSPASVDLPRRQGPSLAERLLPELKEPTPAVTVKWSLIFGMMAVVLGGVLILSVMRDRGGPVALPPVLDDSAPPVTATQDTNRDVKNSEELSRTPARFAQPPTFALALADLVPAELVEQSAKLPEELDHVARRVRVADEPAEAVYREWAALIDTASTTWVRHDDPFNRQVALGVKRVFEEAIDKPAVGERLLEAIGVGAGRLINPLDVVRSPWRIERLAELAQSLRLPPQVRDRSELMLTAALAQAADIRAMAPPEIAAIWLGDVTGLLDERSESSDEPYAEWELWLTAVDRLTDAEGTQSLLAGAVETILASRVDLTLQGASVNVLGRLLETMDWRTSAVVKERVTAWFADGEAITADDLWVLTSIVATRELSEWFDEALILPPQADAAHRRRVGDQIAKAWPSPGDEAVVDAAAAGRGIDVDAALGEEWRVLQSELLATTPVSSPEALAAHLALLVRLNEAASLLERSDTTNAERVLDRVDSAHASISVRNSVAPVVNRPPGQAIGADGVWAAAYAQAGAAADNRINLIRSLRSTAGTDLGPVDAAAFVHEVYRATPAEVRAMAQAVAYMFANGPNVSLQLLDQLPDAIPNEDTSEFLSRLTGRQMPAARSERWRIESRIRLIDHCLSLLPSSEGEIDRASGVIADAVARQGPAALHDAAKQAALSSPAEAAELIRQAWADAMRSVVVAEPVPGDMASLERRHRSRKQLADGPIQSFVASRIGHLELFAFAVTAEQPALRVTVANMLSESEAARAQLPDALQQAVEVERALSKLHALRMRQQSAAPESEDSP